MELERALSGPARDRALPELRGRSLRSAQGHPVQDARDGCQLRRSDQALVAHHRQGRDLPGAVLHQLRRDAVSAADGAVRRAGRVQGPDLPHRALAQGRRLQGQARRCHRDRRDRHPSHPDHCQPGGPAHGIPARPGVRDPDEEPQADRRGSGVLQEAIQRVAPPRDENVRRLRTPTSCTAGGPICRPRSDERIWKRCGKKAR